jgi:HAMP domain-containing protein
MPSFFKRFSSKVTASLILAMFVIVIVSNGLIHRYVMTAQFEQLQDKLKVIARTAALVISADDLMSIPLNKEGMSTTAYQVTSGKLKRIKEENPTIAFIYIMAPTSQEGIWQFIVDADPLSRRREGITSYPGDKYDATRFPQLIRSFHGATADNVIGRDEWGAVLSGYAPILNSQGAPVAVLGVDMLAEDVYAVQRSVNLRVMFLFGLGILLSFLIGAVLSRRITGPVHELAEATRRVSRGDLDHEVRVRGNDEIAELAISFNQMADQLKHERKKNQEYFYSVIQTLVRVVEAKDEYTMGHSERVSGYSVGIARRMGFPADLVDVIRQIALIHDIGKLRISDNILNKKERLTSDEWEAIRRHPEGGEEILRPVSLDPSILTIVRGHHERFDGKGYPDGLAGDRINALSQILSVADAYDAMTSTRAYRQALSKEVAIDELKKNRGTQFNPIVVDAFISLLREEGMR